MPQGRIICIGDDLVVGDEASAVGHRSFRGALQLLLSSAGFDVDFVGSLVSTPAASGSDPEHNGYADAFIDSAGSSLNNIADRVSAIRAAVGAVDLIVLLVGWKDVIANTASIGTRYGSLVSSLIATSPWTGAKVVACTLPPYYNLTEAQTATTYAAYGTLNAAIRSLASATVKIADLAAISGTDATAYIEDMVSRIAVTPGVSTNKGGLPLPSRDGGNIHTSHAGLSAACALWSASAPLAGQRVGAGNMGTQAQGAGHPFFVNNVAALVSWFWSGTAPGDNAPNTGIEVRNSFGIVRRTSGQYVQLWAGARVSGYQTHGATVAREIQRPDGITTLIDAQGDSLWEAWPLDTVPTRGVLNFHGAWNRLVMADAACYIVGCQVRLGLINPAGPNDISAARKIVKLGYDLYAPGGGPYYDYVGFPFYAADGGSVSWQTFASTEWTWVICASIAAGNDPGFPPPWGNYNPGWTYNDSPTYALSPAALRASPPPLPTYVEGRSSSGFIASDYWADNGGTRSWRMLQSGADRIARTISDTMVASGMLTAFVTGSGSQSVSGAATLARWFDRQTGGLWTWSSKNAASVLAPVWATTGLATAVLGSAYSAQLNASGATNYSIVSGAPAWLSCSSSGALSGTPTGGEATHVITFRATNSAGTADLVLTLSVVAAVSVTTTSLPNAVQGQSYVQSLAATGVAPFTWAIPVGTLPPGLSLAGDLITGTPTGTGTSSFTVQVTDALGRTATRALSIVVGAASNLPVITTASLPSGTVGTAYSQTIAATGAGTITRAVVSGSLPPGLSLAPTTGALTGTPTSAGGYGFTVRATNAFGYVETTYYLIIAAAGAAPVASPWAQFVRQ